MALAIEHTNHPFRPLSLAARATSWLCVGTLLVACSSSGDDDDDTNINANAILTDANNYKSTTKLSLSTTEVAADEDIEVCWDQVTSDLLCHEVKPTSDLDHVSLIRFKDESESEVEEQLSSGELNPVTDIDGYFEFDTPSDGTCAKLSRLHTLGNDDTIDLAEEFVASDEFTYVLLVAEGNLPGVGTRSMMFLKPTSSADATTASVPAGCSDAGNILDYEADLESAEKVSISADGPWVVDWSKMEHDGTGNEIAFSSIDSVLLGFYEGMTVEDLQSQIKDLELIATKLWENKKVVGRSMDLADTKERTQDGKAGDRFPGFTSTDGVWVVGLMCSSCQSPAPLVLAILDPQSGA